MSENLRPWGQVFVAPLLWTPRLSSHRFCGSSFQALLHGEEEPSVPTLQDACTGHLEGQAQPSLLGKAALCLARAAAQEATVSPAPAPCSQGSGLPVLSSQRLPFRTETPGAQALSPAAPPHVLLPAVPGSYLGNPGGCSGPLSADTRADGCGLPREGLGSHPLLLASSPSPPGFSPAGWQMPRWLGPQLPTTDPGSRPPGGLSLSLFGTGVIDSKGQSSWRELQVKLRARKRRGSQTWRSHDSGLFDGDPAVAPPGGVLRPELLEVHEPSKASARS